MSVSGQLLRRLQSVDKADAVRLRRRLSADVHAVVTAVQTFSPFRCAELLPNGTVKVSFYISQGQVKCAILWIGMYSVCW